jgi:hypothetical protein
MRRPASFQLLIATCLLSCSLGFAQSGAPDEILQLELRLKPENVPAGKAAPAPRRFRAPRAMVRNPPQPDPDGVYRRAAIGFSAGPAPGDGIFAIQFAVATPKEWEFATLVPAAGNSPLPGLRAVKNDDPKSVGNLYAGDVDQIGITYATCVELMPGKPPPVCVIQVALDSELVVLVTVRRAEFAEWRESVRRARERAKAIQAN